MSGRKKNERRARWSEGREGVKGEGWSEGGSKGREEVNRREEKKGAKREREQRGKRERDEETVKRMGEK
jgi:hypothetical protein